MDGLQEYLDYNPQLKEYVKDGVILWDKLGVDIDKERKYDILFSQLSIKK